MTPNPASLDHTGALAPQRGLSPAVPVGVWTVPNLWPMALQKYEVLAGPLQALSLLWKWRHPGMPPSWLTCKTAQGGTVTYNMGAINGSLALFLETAFTTMQCCERSVISPGVRRECGLRQRWRKVHLK